MEGGMGMAETLQVIPLTDPTGEGVMSDWIDIRQVSRLRLMVEKPAEGCYFRASIE